MTHVLRIALCGVLGSAALVACTHGETPAEMPPAARAQLVAPTVALDSNDAALPGTVYRQALEKARKNITLDHAKQRLEDMDAQIEQEKEMLR